MARKVKLGVSSFTTMALAAMLAGGWSFGSAAAAAPTEQIKTAINQAIAVAEDPVLSDDAKMERLRKIISPRIDFREMSRRALGRHWPRNASRAPEFTSLFQELLERTYVKRVWLKEGRGIKVKYNREQTEENSAFLDTTLITAKGVEIPVGYRLHLGGGEWRVYDILIEGVSLVNNYRVQFDKRLRNSSFDELLAHMRKRVKE